MFCVPSILFRLSTHCVGVNAYYLRSASAGVTQEETNDTLSAFFLYFACWRRFRSAATAIVGYEL